MLRGSPTDIGRWASWLAAVPAWKMMQQLGAWVRCASITPSMGRPVPAKTISPFRISRAAVTAMSSVTV
jgi:hypothetical protein